MKTLAGDMSSSIVDIPEDRFDVEGAQQSMEWLYARCGKITASRFCDVLAKLKSGKPAKDRENYLWEIVIERITGEPVPHYESAAMRWGTENEAQARMSYEASTGAIVTEVGFMLYTDGSTIGASPDGRIGKDGGIEIKCPFNSANHLQTFLDGMPDEHMAQVQGNILVAGAEWWDFISFDPRMPERLQMYVQRIERNQEYIKKLVDELVAFDAEVNAMVAKLGEFQ